jgi:hypothetical protein
LGEHIWERERRRGAEGQGAEQQGARREGGAQDTGHGLGHPDAHGHPEEVRLG